MVEFKLRLESAFWESPGTTPTLVLLLDCIVSLSMQVFPAKLFERDDGLSLHVFQTLASSHTDFQRQSVPSL